MDRVISSDEMVANAAARDAAYITRISALYALLDGTNEIRAEHLRAAMAVWDFCEQSARRIFGSAEPAETQLSKDFKKLRWHLCNNGGQATRTDISVKVFGKHRSTEEIDAIFSELVKVLEMPVAGNYQFPREQAVPTVAWGTENQTFSATTGAPTFDQTAGTNFRRASSVLYVSKQLVQQAQVSEGVESFLARELRKSVAQAISQAVINGSGGTQPTGLANLPTDSGALHSITISTPTTWAQILAADTTVENLNAYALDGTDAWLVNPNTKASWAQTPKTPTALTNGFCFDYDTKTVNGHSAFSTTECQNVAFYSTRWSSVLVLLAGSVSVLVDPYGLAHVNQVRIVTDVLLDVIVRRPETICIATTTF